MRPKLSIERHSTTAWNGQQIPSLTWEDTDARFGFQGQTRDDEIAGKGNSLNTFFRQNNTQTGVWLSIDPMVDKMPERSPYSLYGTNPINRIDSDGDWDEKHHEMATRRAIQELVDAGEIEKLSDKQIALIVKGNVDTDKMSNPINHGFNLKYGLMFWAVHSWTPKNLSDTPEKRKKAVKYGKAYRQGVIDDLKSDLNNNADGIESPEFLTTLGELTHIEQDPSADSHGFDVEQEIISGPLWSLDPREPSILVVPSPTLPTVLFLPGNQQYYGSIEHGKGDKLAPEGTATAEQMTQSVNATKKVLREFLPAPKSDDGGAASGSSGGNGVGLIDP
jgi:RHS repeat-associated protein